MRLVMSGDAYTCADACLGTWRTSFSRETIHAFVDARRACGDIASFTFAEQEFSEFEGGWAEFPERLMRWLQRSQPQQALPDLPSATTRAEAVEIMAADLVPHLRAEKVNWHTPPEGGGRIGISSGQLYYLIKEIRIECGHTDNALKHLLLEKLLGPGKLAIVRSGAKEYFCALAEDWLRVAGPLSFGQP